MTVPVTLIVDESLAEPLGGVPPNVVVVPRRRMRWHRRRARWAALEPEVVFNAIAAAPRPAVVLVRPPSTDPGAVALVDIAGLLGLEVRRLADDPGAAAWCVGVASRTGDSGAAVGRTLDVLCSVASTGERFVHIDTPLRARSLRRWATHAWRPCRWCPAGGCAGRRCARCGSPLVEDRA